MVMVIIMNSGCRDRTVIISVVITGMIIMICNAILMKMMIWRGSGSITTATTTAATAAAAHTADTTIAASWTCRSAIVLVCRPLGHRWRGRACFHIMLLLH